MKRVAVISPLSCSHPGGITTFSLRLQAAIEQSTSVRCFLLTPLLPPLSFKRRPISTLVSLIAILANLIRLSPNCLLVQGHPALLLPAALYRLGRERIRVVFTFHTDPRSGSVQRTQANLVRELLRFCDVVAFTSRYLLEQVARLLALPPRTRLQVVYPGATLVSSPEEERSRIANLVSGHKPVLTYVGVLDWEEKVRGLKLLLDAVADLRLRWPNVLLLVAGSGRLRSEALGYCLTLGLKEHVVFLGSVMSPEACFRVTDIYVHITFQENLSLAVLEAMAAGLPVVASDTGAMREMISHRRSGLIVRPVTEDIVSAIETIMMDRESASKMGRTARDEVETAFRWERAATQYMALCQHATPDCSRNDQAREVPPGG